ncbi:DinB superfamily protein [Neolewinella agarilytica]|uniref:DinB superfamily protein n=2 Tax=Neolewinella agarilytica TaxID=478744 RepID=A0A1H9P945_9BACT|nr:DinB superfamily protein [Neolewinella agarilytica]
MCKTDMTDQDFVAHSVCDDPNINLLMTNTDYFVSLYETLHRKMPFFGSGIEESLERIPEEHLHRPVGHRTIAQLLAHMIAWREDLIKRLHELPREKIEINSPEDWPDATGKTKADFLRAFADTKVELQKGLEKYDVSKMYDLVHPDYDYINVNILEGGAQHDIYHIGQVNMLAAILRELEEAKE